MLWIKTVHPGEQHIQIKLLQTAQISGQLSFTAKEESLKTSFSELKCFPLRTNQPFFVTLGTRIFQCCQILE